MHASESRWTICTLGLLLGALAGPGWAVVPVRTVEELVRAVERAQEGDSLELAAGTFVLTAPLDLKGRMTLKGAGMDRTLLTGAPTWQPSTQSLPDPEMKMEGLDTQAYLIRVRRDTAGVTISDLTLHGPQLHGAIFSWFSTGLHLHHLRIRETRWCGVRTFGMKRAKIHDCEFVDAGGRWQQGAPGVKGGITGGGLFAVWMSDSEIWDNRFLRTRTAPEHEFYGIKVRQAKRCRVHHNTIETNFSLEFPFENDEDNELDHNVFHGTVSLPKHAGGPVPQSGRTFHIHHNLFKNSYSIEFVRNGVEIAYNRFDFDLAADHGNLISGFGRADAPGPAVFHNNLIRHPGRGVIWIHEVFNRLEVRNNHIRTRTTRTPRQEGLFGFNPKCDFRTVVIRDNRIECEGQPRPLLRNAESYAAVIENNLLVNVADAERLPNPPAPRPVGLEAPLQFTCGVKGEVAVDGWTVEPAPSAAR
jgi:nitrous oxidase accessory protein